MALVTLAFAVDGPDETPVDVVAVAAPSAAPTATPQPTPSPEPEPVVAAEARQVEELADTDAAAVVGQDYIPSFVVDDLSAYGANVSAPVAVTEAPAEPAPAAEPDPQPVVEAPQPTPAPTAPPAPTPTPTSTPAPADDAEPVRDDQDDDDGQPPTADDWAALRACESGGSYTVASGNGYYGAYQFSQATWDWIAGMVRPRWVGELPSDAPPEVQDAMALTLYDLRGAAPWPTCGEHLR